MKVVLQFLAVCSLLLAAPKASGLALRDLSGDTETTKLKSENLLYDAIFNSSILAQYAKQTLNTTVDSQTQACLDTHTLRNVEVLQATGTKMRWCTFVSEMDLEKFFNTHDEVTFKLSTMEKIVRCTHTSNGFRMLECYADTMATALNTVKVNDLSYYYFQNFNYNWRQKRCLQNELYRLVPKMYVESDRLMNCMRQVNVTPPVGTGQQSVNSTKENGSNNNVTDQWITLPPWSNYTNSNSTNSTASRTKKWVTLSPISNLNNSNVNETNPWVTLPSLSDSTNSNLTFPPWNNSTKSNVTNPWIMLPPWNNSSILSTNETKPWMTLPPLNNSTNSNATNSNATWVSIPLLNNSINSNKTNPWITLPPWNNSTNFNTNETKPLMTLPPWTNSSNSNATNPWGPLSPLNNSTNRTYSNFNWIDPWVAIPLSNNSMNSNVTNPWITLPSWNNSTNSITNGTNSWITLPPWNNSIISNLTNPWGELPPSNNSTYSININPNGTILWATQLPRNNSTIYNVTNPWHTLPPLSNSTNSNFTPLPWSNSTHSKSNEKYSGVTIANTTVVHALNNTKSPAQSPIFQSIETVTEPTTPSNVKKPSWWSSMWHKVTNIFN